MIIQMLNIDPSCFKFDMANLKLEYVYFVILFHNVQFQEILLVLILIHP